jgi:demethoxyubiquinone hydroxylase (CLK1/Coq7/Cat5 family)
MGIKERIAQGPARGTVDRVLRAQQVSVLATRGFLKYASSGGQQQQADELQNRIHQQASQRRVRPSIIQPFAEAIGMAAGITYKLILSPLPNNVAEKFVQNLHDANVDACNDHLRDLVEDKQDVKTPEVCKLVREVRDAELVGTSGSQDFNAQFNQDDNNSTSNSQKLLAEQISLKPVARCLVSIAERI